MFSVRSTISCWRNELLGLLLVLGGGPALWGAAAPGLHLAVASGRDAVVAPGRVVTAAILIRNETDGIRPVTEDIAPPAGWRLVGGAAGALELPARGEQLRVLAFAVPAGTAAGEAELGYGLQAGDRDLARVAWRVAVAPVERIEVQFEPPPPFVVGGTDYRLSVRVTNRGNAAQTVHLTLAGAPPPGTRLESTALALGPGASGRVVVLVPATGSEGRRLEHVFTVRAGPAPSPSAATLAQSTVVVPVIPRAVEKVDPYRWLPARLRVIGVATRGPAQTGRNDGLLFEYAGEGMLDERGKQAFDFVFRGPGLRHSTELVARSEYALTYRQAGFTVEAGDRVYSLSPLTERFRHARGAAFAFRSPELEGRAFAFRHHPDDPTMRAAGAGIRGQIAPGLRLGGNVLAKQGEPDFISGERGGRVYSVEAEWSAGRALQAAVEYARSGNDRLGEFHDGAYAVDVRGRWSEAVAYEARITHTDPKFLGVYADFDHAHASVRADLSRALQAYTHYRAYENDLNPDPARTTVANRERGLTAGLALRPSARSEVAVEANRLRRQDTLLPADYDYDERAVALRLRHRFRQLDAELEVGAGRIRDRAGPGDWRPLARHGVHLQWRPVATGYWGVFARRGEAGPWGGPRRTVNLGTGAGLQLGRRFDVSLQYQRNYYDPFIREEHDQFGASLRYTTARQHTVELRGYSRWSGAQRDRETTVVAGFSLPLPLPVGRKREVGHFGGAVWRGGSGAQAAGPVVLRVGEQAAVADASGRFVFPDLAPGRYPLQIEQGSLGYNRVTAERLPETVLVEGGRTTRLEVAVVDAAGLSGTIVRVNGGYQPMAGVRVRVSRGGEAYLQTADGAGRLVFAQLRPGRWLVEVDPAALPAQHVWDQSRFEIDLEAGRVAEFSFRAQPRVRVPIMVESGEIR